MSNYTKTIGVSFLVATVGGLEHMIVGDAMSLGIEAGAAIYGSIFLGKLIKKKIDEYKF